MKLAKLLIPCLLVLACNASAQAQDGLGLAYLFGYGGVGGARYPSTFAAPPYFALHPPVYYGERFTRPYGVSPFAAWPQLQPSPSYAPQPHVNRWQAMSTPHCVHCGTSAAVAPHGIVQAPAKPIEIDNPFFQPEAVYTSAD